MSNSIALPRLRVRKKRKKRRPPTIDEIFMLIYTALHGFIAFCEWMMVFAGVRFLTIDPMTPTDGADIGIAIFCTAAAIVFYRIYRYLKKENDRRWGDDE